LSLSNCTKLDNDQKSKARLAGNVTSQAPSVACASICDSRDSGGAQVEASGDVHTRESALHAANLKSKDMVKSVRTFSDLFDAMCGSTQSNKHPRQTALMILDSQLSFQQKCYQVYELCWSVTNAMESEAILTSLVTRATTLSERHDALKLLALRYAHFEEYDKGIGALRSIVEEQESNETPNPRVMCGACQELSALSAMRGEHAESLRWAFRAYENALKENSRESIAGSRSFLAEALANNGKFSEACKQVAEIRKQYPHSRFYRRMQKKLEPYVHNPGLWKSNRPVFNYHY